MRHAYRRIAVAALGVMAGFLTSTLLANWIMRLWPKRAFVEVRTIRNPDTPIDLRVVNVDHKERIVEIEVENRRDSTVLCYILTFEVYQESRRLQRWFSGLEPGMRVFFLSDPDTDKDGSSYIPPYGKRREEFDISSGYLLSELSVGELARWIRKQTAATLNISVDLVLFQDGMAVGPDEHGSFLRWQLYFERFPARARALLERMEREGLQGQIRWAEDVTSRQGSYVVRDLFEGLASEDPARRQAAMDQYVDFFLAHFLLGGVRKDPERLIPDLRKIAEYKLTLWRP